MRRSRKPWRQHSEPAPVAEMNTTPLIDVMLVLLIMLIVSIPVQLHAVNLRLGQSAAPPPTPSAPVQLDVSASGAISWNTVTLSQTELAQRLSALATQASPAMIELRPDPHSSYQVVASVLAAVQRAGLSRLAVQGTP